jgi:hypothetical protein
MPEYSGILRCENPAGCVKVSPPANSASRANTAKNVGFLHRSSGTRLSERYDAVPNLHQSGRINWDMAMAINGVIEATLREFADAQASVAPPNGVDPAVRLGCNESQPHSVKIDECDLL